MANITGPKGELVLKLMEESDKEFANNNFELSIQLLEKAWIELPEPKVDFDESYFIIWGILVTCLQINDMNRANKWVSKIFICDPERIDSGEREYWAGKIAYESGDYETAKEYLMIANQKSNGRCFETSDGKYIRFLKQ